MTKAIDFKPEFPHNCDRCTFLLHYVNWDVYYCAQFDEPNTIPTLVMRAGAEPQEYMSFPFFSHETLLSSGAFNDSIGKLLVEAMLLGRICAHHKGLYDIEKERHLRQESTIGALCHDIKVLVAEFESFSDECDMKDGTDIGDAWDMMRALCDGLRKALGILETK
jgi:hypothetical protein